MDKKKLIIPGVNKKPNAVISFKFYDNNDIEIFCDRPMEVDAIQMRLHMALINLDIQKARMNEKKLIQPVSTIGDISA